MYDLLFFDPLFNAFLYLLQFSGYSMGLAIILLTVLVRAVLYIPMHKSMMNSKTMQKLQPRLQEIRKEHADNQQALAMATMALYKEHGVNPLSSCLPILLQIPVLLAVFGVLRLDFADTAILAEHAYADFAAFDLSLINFDFFGLDMSLIVSEGMKEGAKYFYAALPILVGLSQYFSLKLVTAQNHKKITDITPNEKDEPNQMKQMEQMSQMMTRILPMFVTIISYTFQAGLSIYWFVSTVLGIFQQLFINAYWEKLNKARITTRGASDVTVEVIDGSTN